MSRASKRLKLDSDHLEDADASIVRQQRANFLASVSRTVSPPPGIRGSENKQTHESPNCHDTNSVLTTSSRSETHHKESTGLPKTKSEQSSCTAHQNIPSPFKLTKIKDLPASANIDTVSLHDILGDPLIKTAWIFNFCFDVDWVMKHFDSDTRALVDVKIIHGSWKKEDNNRIGIEEACARWPNVKNFAAFLPDPFGTHHSKMFVLFTHVDTVEIIIHTANMLEKDWTNLTQAVWRTGPLRELILEEKPTTGPIGSGTRFKQDFMAYLKGYSHCHDLAQQLQRYDFSSVRGALVGSIPCKIKQFPKSTPEQHLWGYPQLREVISSIKASPSTELGKPSGHLVCQISSIASLPSGWLATFLKAATPNDPQTIASSIVYPTPSNVANSLDGYMAGGSIHTKAQSDTHLKQINSFRSQLNQWREGSANACRSGRHLAAPHIKTYIKFESTPTIHKPRPDILWALLTSANLSTQAWGSLPRLNKGVKDKSEHTIHIQSFELGVVVWPELFSDEFGKTEEGSRPKPSKIRMVPVFGKDQPPPSDEVSGDSRTLVGLRMPYDLPLSPYGATELPWSPRSRYDTPDSHGNMWGGY